MPKTDDSLLEYIDESFPSSSPTYHSLDDDADSLLLRLRQAHKNNTEVEIFRDLGRREIDSVGILAESGEAQIYRNNNQRLCIRYAKPGILSSMFSLSA